MKLTFLGTSAALPTEERNHPAALLSYNSENILFDCGEGTQRQLRIAKLSAQKLTRIVISHFHGDHILGIPGLLQSLALGDFKKKLYIYGPKGTKVFFSYLFKSFKFIYDIDLEIKEIGEGTFLETENFSLQALKLEHYNCLGYCFVEKDKRRINLSHTKKLGIKPSPLLGQLQKGKDVVFNGKKVRAGDATFLVKGKKLAIILDTAYCANAIKLAKDADLLVCEASFLEEMKEKALAYKHLTAKQAGMIAKQARAKKLVITHISQRYKAEENKLLEEAKKVFPNTQLAKDFMTISV